jgi:hypothetical protein
MARICGVLFAAHMLRMVAAHPDLPTSGWSPVPPMESDAPPVHSICHACAQLSTQQSPPRLSPTAVPPHAHAHTSCGPLSWLVSGYS